MEEEKKDIKLSDIIKKKLNEIWNGIKTMTGGDVSNYLVELSSLLATLGERIIDFDQAYANVQLKLFETYGDTITTKEVEVRAKGTEEYRDFQRGKVLEKAVFETIRALKYKIKTLENEGEASHNM